MLNFNSIGRVAKLTLLNEYRQLTLAKNKKIR